MIDLRDISFTNITRSLLSLIILITLSGCGKQGKLLPPDGEDDKLYPATYPKIEPLTCEVNGEVLTEEELDEKLGFRVKSKRKKKNKFTSS